MSVRSSSSATQQKSGTSYASLFFGRQKSARSCCCYLLTLLICIVGRRTSHAFAPPLPHRRHSLASASVRRINHRVYESHRAIIWFRAKDNNDNNDEYSEEESRLKVLASRRSMVRFTLKNAESMRNFRISNGFVPQIDPLTGKPLKSDSKFALTITAFLVAAGAILLRVGGRAALVSAIGLDFASDNPGLRNNLNDVVSFAHELNPLTQGGLFVFAWTLVKVLCFDAGGVVLALSSGILFGGVVNGALASAAAATIGSTVAFSLAKLETPFRDKALKVMEEYPSLRGIEKVVARDGLKAILTLRLAPVLPIPIGMYNYVYGVTNVRYLDFCIGIFLGSFKPYLLDSYLGVFGKEILDGDNAADVIGGGMQDVILLIVLGFSVLIGIFASQLAGETWESVTEEIEAEKVAMKNNNEEESNDGAIRVIMGMELPQWIVGFQLSLKAAEERMIDFILKEYDAGVWNYTTPLSKEVDPAYFVDSPEIADAGKGFDFGASICDGMVLSPSLLKAFLKYADPLYNNIDDEEKSDVVSSFQKIEPFATTNNSVIQEHVDLVMEFNDELQNSTVGSDDKGLRMMLSSMSNSTFLSSGGVLSDDLLLNVLEQLRIVTHQKIMDLDKRLKG